MGPAPFSRWRSPRPPPTCVPIHDLAGRATDEWTHTYPLNAGRRNPHRQHQRQYRHRRHRRIDGRGARRTDRPRRHRSAARELLPRIVIKEDATPERVSLETEKMSGIMIGASFEVRYHVTAPKSAAVTATNTNGQVIADRH